MTGETRSAVVAYVRAHPGQRPAQVADGTGLGHETIKKMLQRLAATGTLRASRGRYYAGGKRHLVPIPAAGDNDGVPGMSPNASADAAGDTTTPEVVPVVPGNIGGRWRCGDCHWLQVVATVTHCEFCGASRSGQVPW